MREAALAAAPRDYAAALAGCAESFDAAEAAPDGPDGLRVAYEAIHAYHVVTMERDKAAGAWHACEGREAFRESARQLGARRNTLDARWPRVLSAFQRQRDSGQRRIGVPYSKPARPDSLGSYWTK